MEAFHVLTHLLLAVGRYNLLQDTSYQDDEEMGKEVVLNIENCRRRQVVDHTFPFASGLHMIRVALGTFEEKQYFDSKPCKYSSVRQ